MTVGSSDPRDRQLPEGDAECPADGGGPLSAAPPAAVPTAAPADTPQASPLPPRWQGPLLVSALAVAGSFALTLALMGGGAAPNPEVTAAVGPPAEEPRPDAASPATSRTWSAANRATWAGRGRNAVAFDVEADETVAVWMRTVRPVLVVRCADGRTEVFVFTQSAAKIEPQTDDHTVTYALDDGAEVAERWPDSDDHDALFAPDGASFARRLAGARTLRFGFTPHNAPPASATFQVAGLDRHLATAARPCGWTS